MGKWGKWALLLVVAMAFAVPALAVDLKLGGKYEIQGRYYDHWDIKENELTRDHTNKITTMYLKHYFNLYPTIIVNDKIHVVADLEVFDNKISKSDSYHSYDKSSSSATNANTGGVGQGNVDYYSLFTVNELYVDALTGVGKFIVGKTNKFDGIGWFIQVPQVPDWTFGLVWNKLNEGKNVNSYYYDGTLDEGDSTPEALVYNRDLADEDDFALIANYAKDAIDFKGTLAYKYTGKDNSQTRIWLPYFYLNYALNKNLTINSKFGIGMGPLAVKDSPVAVATVEELATAAGALAPVITTNNPDGFKKDLEVDNAFMVWLGAGLNIDAMKVQGDIMYLKGGDAPNKVSGYAEDNEGLDTWLMNDIADLYSPKIQTPATINALLPGGKRQSDAEGGAGSKWDGAFSYANAIMARINLAYKFTPKLDGNLNLVYARMENTDYLEKWNTTQSINNGLPGELNATIPVALYKSLNTIDPDAMKVGGSGILYPGTPFVMIAAPSADYDVNADMGYEVRARLNYALQENLSLGLDLCYYAPGKLYKGYIEESWDPTGATDTGVKMKNTYAARWKATVKF